MSALSIPEILFIALALVLGVAALVFWIWMLVDCIKSTRFTGRDRLIWVIVIAFLEVIGAAVYYFVQYRPHRTVASG